VEVHQGCVEQAGTGKQKKDSLNVRHAGSLTLLVQHLTHPTTKKGGNTQAEKPFLYQSGK
jgi:hypothetical protein